MSKQVVQLNRVIIRFAGDSGDGMQLTGDQFTSRTAWFGNDVATLPDFPAEIRAPAGTIPGVSAFQLHFADHDITTAGDTPNVLVAMNPAALKANMHDLPRGADIIVNTDEFTPRNLAKVGYDASPVDDGSLESYAVHPIPLTSLTVEALKGFDITKKEAERAKNMFALGLLSWLYHRPTEGTLTFLKQKFAKKPRDPRGQHRGVRGRLVLRRDHRGLLGAVRGPARADARRARYRNISGNLALAYGLIAAAQRAELPLFLGSYPITPASDILHELSKHKRFGVMTFQAEDEIAGVGVRDRRGLRRHARRHDHVGPRRRAEVRGDRPRGEPRAAAGDRRRAARRPVDRSARPRPSRPTCCRRCSAATARRRCRSWRRAPPATASTPPSRPCASRRPTARRCSCSPTATSPTAPSRGASRTSTRCPTCASSSRREHNHTNDDGSTEFWPYQRDPETLARPWAVPGTKGLEHRIGGIEKADGIGNISYDADNHDRMVAAAPGQGRRHRRARPRGRRTRTATPAC